MKYVLMLGLSLISSVAFPQGVPEQRVLPIVVFQELGPALSPAVPAVSRDGSGKVRPLDAASPLSYVGILAVGSTLYGGWEILSANQLSTAGSHGGSQLRVVVDTIGYGRAAIAKINGIVLPAAALYQTESLCNVNGRYTTPCPIGSIVAGFRQYFNLDGQSTPGTFSYQNTSQNYPWNTLSTQVYIK
ncbi:DUF4879 domain-containing protein [Chromobacterium alticapitis]|nr:DUF4879 domain-containing protein [Chromobacterium alticapitis]